MTLFNPCDNVSHLLQCFVVTVRPLGDVDVFLSVGTRGVSDCRNLLRRIKESGVLLFEACKLTRQICVQP